MEDKKSVIIIVGPTASGKSELAVKFARKIVGGGEIISADSRQVYKGMDIGSGKVPGKWQEVMRYSKPRKVFVYKGVPHYLIDEVSPLRQYSVARFQREAKKIIEDILRRGKTPIVCGGTAHWVDAVAYDQSLPEVRPDKKLRAQLEKLSTEALFKRLQKLDPERAKEIDAKNPRRLIRALEIVMTTGAPVPKQKQASPYNLEWVGINIEMTKLEKNIAKRLKSRLKAGMLKEIKKLHAGGVSWKKLESFGLEYKFCALHLQGKLSLEEMEQLLFIAIRQYAKRQMTWWKRNRNIKWLSN